MLIATVTRHPTQTNQGQAIFGHQSGMNQPKFHWGDYLSRNPIVIVGAVLTMSPLGIAASAIPALRAMAIDPSKLLREE